MITQDVAGKMWADLLTSEKRAQDAQHYVTARAVLYVEAGLPLERVLDALGVSRATWYRRVQALEAWRASRPTPGRRTASKVNRLLADFDPAP